MIYFEFKFFENQIQEYLKKDVENHVEQWKKEMHMILIKMLSNIYFCFYLKHSFYS